MRQSSAHSGRRRPARGFTLMEMLVVLVILSVTGAIVLPRLTTISSSFDFALKRETLEQNLNALSYQAYKNNQDLILAGEYTDAGRIVGSETQDSSGNTIDGSMRTISLIPTARDHLAPLNPFFFVPTIPAGWHMQVADPIYFRSSGYCTGGKVDVTIGRAEYIYVLAPPLCHATLAE